MKRFKRNSLLILLVFILLCNAQEEIKKLDSVPKEFAEKYLQKEHDWNPLWVGNYWQYSTNDDEYIDRYIDKDTLVDGKTYYKKTDYQGFGERRFFHWERNNWNTYSSYMLDIEDMNENSITNEELLLDSLEVEDSFYEYKTYRFAYAGWKDLVWYGPITARVRGPEWYKVFSDTVLVRMVEYLEIFQTEYVADQFGVIRMTGDFYQITLTGARIYQKEYGTIVSVDDEPVKNKFELSQNYPNPFNPTTKIKFAIPSDLKRETSNVKLIVYDILGREIKTLINKPMQPGDYEVEFDATGLPSGVYFYRLSSGSFNQTRKMVLLR